MTNPLDTRTEELIAIGAALASNCEPCLRYHVRRGAEVGCTQEEMRRAVAIAQDVKATPARLLARLADRLLGTPLVSGEPGTTCEMLAAQPASAPSACCGTPTEIGGDRHAS
jgi:AhpD family alkylhydroperoxidase